MLASFYTYKTLADSAEFELKERGSKFIAQAFTVHSVDEFKQKLKVIKAQHPKANHHCFAYRIGTDKLNFRVADDGEPSGSAGKPILAAIDSAGLSNVAIVVIRYFGGTLLGVPGLITAYRGSATEAINKAGIIEKEETNTYELEFDYTIQSAVQQVLHQLQAEIISTENLLFCKITARVKKSDFLLANQLFDNVYNLSYKLV